MLRGRVIRRPHYHKMMIYGKGGEKKKMVTGELIPISKERMWPLGIVNITYSLQTTNLMKRPWNYTKKENFNIYLYEKRYPEISYKPQVLEVIPDNSDGKESSCNAGDPGSIPGSGQPTRLLCP